MALIGQNAEQLFPTADVGVNNFITSTGSDYFDLVDDWEAATYIYRINGIGRTFDFTFSDIPEASEDNIVIDSVQFGVYARSTSTTGDKRDSVTLTMTMQTGNGLVDYFDDNLTWEVGLGPQTLYGTERTTTDGSTAWTFSTINDLRLHGEWTANVGGGDESIFVYTVFFRIRYTYTSVLTTYTSDDNIIIKEGLVELKNGMIEIKGP